MFKNKYTYIKALLIFFIVAFILFATNDLWLKSKPLQVSADIFGKNRVSVSFYIDAIFPGKTINLEKTNNTNFLIDKHSSFKNIKFIFKLSKEKTPELKIKNVSLKNGKIKLDDLSKFSVNGATKEINGDELILKTNSDKVVLSYPINSRPTKLFQTEKFLLILLLPFILLWFLIDQNTVINLCNKFVELKKQLNIKNFIPFGIALTFFLITNILNMDKLFFDEYVFVGNKIFIKILFLIFSTICWYFIFFVAKKFKEPNENNPYRRAVNIFCIYSILMVIVMIIVWPGTWVWDDIVTLVLDTQYKLFAWQCILTSIEHLLFLQILPFPAGIIIIQNLFISAIVAFVVLKLENTYNLFLKNRFWDMFLKLLPFLLFPVLRYQFSGYRMGICTYLEIMIIVMLLCGIKNKEKWSGAYFTLFCFLAAIVINWRSENIFYLPAFLILFYFLDSLAKKKTRLIFCLLLMVMTCTIGGFQNKFIKNNNYKIMSTLNPLVAIVRNIDTEKYKTNLDIIDKVVILKIVYKYPKISGDVLYWKKHIVREYTSQEYKNYLKQYLYLIVKNPKIFISERFNLYFRSLKRVGFKGQAVLFKNPPRSDSIKRFKSSAYMFNKPILPSVRYAVLRNIDGEYLHNHLIPTIFIAVLCIYLLYKKFFKEFILAAAVLIKVPIIFLSEPIAWWMYWLSLYSIGYLIFVYFLLYYLSKKQR